VCMRQYYSSDVFSMERTLFNPLEPSTAELSGHRGSVIANKSKWMSNYEVHMQGKHALHKDLGKIEF
jgi:hypothetical protein